MKNENERLKGQIAVYQDEQKEAQIRYSELEQEVKMLRLKTLDVSEFMQWEWETVLFWIVSLENGRFKPYENALRDNLSEEKVRGSDLSEVNEVDVKGWGVKQFGDKKALIRHIRNLVQHQGVHGVAKAAKPAPKAQEGARTEFH